MSSDVSAEIDAASPWRSPVRAGIAVAVILFASSVALALISAASQIGLFPGDQKGAYVATLAGQLGDDLVREVLFGGGVLLGVRFFVASGAQSGRGGVIRSIVVVAAAGLVVVFVAYSVLAVVTATNPGAYPFGYAFQPTTNGFALGSGILSALVSGLVTFVVGLPVTAVVLLWQRLAAREKVDATAGRPVR